MPLLTMLRVSTCDSMSFFGLTDPYIVASYIGCFLSVIICCAIGFKLKPLTDDEEGEEND